MDDTDDCPTTCASAACGDGYLWAGNEECDDGNVDSNDGCLLELVGSCKAIKDGQGNTSDGVYAIGPDGNGGSTYVNSSSTCCKGSQFGARSRWTIWAR